MNFQNEQVKYHSDNEIYILFIEERENLENSSSQNLKLLKKPMRTEIAPSKSYHIRLSTKKKNGITLLLLDQIARK